MSRQANAIDRAGEDLGRAAAASIEVPSPGRALVSAALRVARTAPAAVSVGIDWAYLRRKRAQILDALAFVRPGSDLRVRSADPTRRNLDEMAAAQIVEESRGAVQLLGFGEYHFTLVRTPTFMATTGTFDRDFFRMKGTLVGAEGARVRITQAALALRLLRR